MCWQRWMKPKNTALGLALLLIFCVGGVSAQTTTLYQVYVTPGALDRLTFIDVLTGAQTRLDVDGERFTILEDGVLFFDRTTRRARAAAPNGTLRDHPFAQLTGDATRIDWTVGGGQIAWTLTSGSAPNLFTTTLVANLDGSNQREVFADSNSEGVRAFPVLLSTTTLYMDYQPDVIGDITPFRQYAGMFALDLATGETAMLPGEPGCFCGGGIGAGRFVRLTLAANLGGFDARVVDLTTGSDRLIAGLGAFTQGGDVVIAPDGRYAAYALGDIRDLGLPTQRVRTVIALIDLATMTQRQLLAAEGQVLRPFQFTEGALLLLDPQANTTLKADLATGALVTVAHSLYLGTVQIS